MPFLVIVIAVILALYFGPMLLLWAINYLFHFYIDYTFGSWVAVMVIWSIFQVRIFFK